MTTTKLDQLRGHVAAGDQRKAIRLAATFDSLGDAKEDVTRAAAAMTSPAIYEEMGWDVEKLKALAMQAIRKRYEWNEQ